LRAKTLLSVRTRESGRNCRKGGLNLGLSPVKIRKIQLLSCWHRACSITHWDTHFLGGNVVAESNAASAATQQPGPSGQPGGKPTLFILLALINMAVVIAVGVMLYLGQKKRDAVPGIEDAMTTDHDQVQTEEKGKNLIGKLVPLETFLVNVAGTRGRKLVKINMELEVSNSDVQEEIEKIKPKIRDYIIIIASSKSFNEMSSKEGKDALRDEIRNQLNLFLTKGSINKVYFTEFILN
jgi:flagellar FliL protein